MRRKAERLEPADFYGSSDWDFPVDNGDIQDDYMAGFASADALFDQDPEDVPVRAAETAMSEWDRALNKTAIQSNLLPVDKTKKREQELIALNRDGIEAEYDAKEYQNYTVPERLKERIEAGRAARKELFDSNLRLAAWFARESMGLHKEQAAKNGKRPSRSVFARVPLHDFASAPLDFTERFQAAAIGLQNAIDRHDPARGALAALAVYHMEASLRKVIATNPSRFISKVPEDAQDEQARIRRAVEDAQAVAKQPNLERIAYEVCLDVDSVMARVGQMTTAKAGLSIQQLDEALQRAADKNGVTPDEVLTVADRVAEHVDLDTFGEVLDGYRVQAVDDLISSYEMSGREHDILEMSFGLKDGIPIPQVEIAEMFCVTRSAIGQTRKNALKKLREPARSRHVEYLVEDSENPYSGLPGGMLHLTADEAVQLEVAEPELTLFDRAPFNRQASQQERRFVYQEDWSEDDL